MQNININLEVYMRDIIRIPIRLKIATGTYILQANRASFNRSQLNPICLLCENGEETLEHFLLTCNCLDGIRAPLVKEIINTCSALILLFIRLFHWYFDSTVSKNSYGSPIPYFINNRLISINQLLLLLFLIDSWSYKIGQCHPLATTISANMRDIIRIPIRLKIATGTYILQANRASFKW
jgi:hypothetical protein